MNARLPNKIAGENQALRRRFKRGTIEVAIACALTLAALIYIAVTRVG